LAREHTWPPPFNIPRSAPGLATKLGHTYSMVTQQPLSKQVLKSTPIDSRLHN